MMLHCWARLPENLYLHNFTIYIIYTVSLCHEIFKRYSFIIPIRNLFKMTVKKSVAKTDANDNEKNNDLY